MIKHEISGQCGEYRTTPKVVNMRVKKFHSHVMHVHIMMMMIIIIHSFYKKLTDVSLHVGLTVYSFFHQSRLYTTARACACILPF